jgi:hypothetical protein
LYVFKDISYILHHFAFLFWSPTQNFSSPITRFLPLKYNFLMTISPFSAMYLMVREGFIYTIAADIYAFRLAFSTILHCVLHHFTLHLAPKRTAFCIKTHFILLLIVPKRVLVVVRLNKNTFYLHVQLPPFDTKTNLCENRFFATR